MRAVIQRVARASVTSEGKVLGRVGRGLLVFVGIGPGDDPAKARWMAEKILRMRIFEDGEGKMNLSVEEAGGALPVVSQFTLYADAVKGNRPGFSGAAPPDVARPLVEEMVRHLRSMSRIPVETGSFGARMEV